MAGDRAMTAESVVLEIVASMPRIRVNADGTIDERDAREIEVALLQLTGNEHRVDRTNNLLVDRTVRVVPVPSLPAHPDAHPRP